VSAAVTLTRVESSQIAAIGYSPDTSELSVLFKNRDGSNGSLYVYDSVEPETYAGLAAAESVGSQFAQSIKRGGYEFRKLDSAGVVIDGEVQA